MQNMTHIVSSKKQPISCHQPSIFQAFSEHLPNIFHIFQYLPSTLSLARHEPTERRQLRLCRGRPAPEKLRRPRAARAAAGAAGGAAGGSGAVARQTTWRSEWIPKRF